MGSTKNDDIKQYANAIEDANEREGLYTMSGHRGARLQDSTIHRLTLPHSQLQQHP